MDGVSESCQILRASSDRDHEAAILFQGGFIRFSGAACNLIDKARVSDTNFFSNTFLHTQHYIPPFPTLPGNNIMEISRTFNLLGHDYGGVWNAHHPEALPSDVSMCSFPWATTY